MGPRMGSCVCGAVPPHSTTRNLGEKGRMLLSASILLLGCSSAFADAHANSMGRCEVKRVPGSLPKSGLYYLDTEYSGSLPDICKNSCVYNAESGPAKYCFSPSSTYTAECQDSGDVTGASLEDLTAKVKTIQEKMESVGTDIEEAETTKAAAEDNSDKIDSLDNLIREKKAELNSLLYELNALMENAPAPPNNPCGSGGGNGTLSYMQCNGEEDGTSCTKMCTADDCRPPQAKCCNGCCRRGNTLAEYGCETK